MNKIFGIAGVVGAAMLLAGCSWGPVKDTTVPEQTMQQEQSTTQTQTQTQEQMGPAQWAAELATGKKMQCSYSSSEMGGQGVAVKMYAEQGRYKTETEIQAGTMISLFDGKTIYNWMQGEKVGTKLDMQCMQEFEMQKPVQERNAQSYKSPEEAIQNTPDIACAELSEDVDFSVPSDITFTDQCAVLQQSMESMKKAQEMQGTMPANIPTNIPDDVKAMMGQ